MRAMSRALRCRLLTLLLIALAAAWALPGMPQPAVQGLAHDLVHLQSVSHHHHDDASLHLDEGAAAEATHHHAADGAKPMALCDAALPDRAGPPSASPATRAGPHCLKVVLEGPLRPPRSKLA
jgi:hypothetical protein